MSSGRPQICLIAAMSRNRVIGINGDLPWRLPVDMRFFKQTTLGHSIIMGRKTFETFPKLLPDRRHIVITRQTDYDGRGADVVGSFEQALELVADEPRAFVIGGEQIYQLAIASAQTIYLTKVETEIDDGDAFFPEFEGEMWSMTEETSHPADDRHAHAFRFQTYQRQD
jgi:dihydrofolate reductase